MQFFCTLLLTAVLTCAAPTAMAKQAEVFKLSKKAQTTHNKLIKLTKEFQTSSQEAANIAAQLKETEETLSTSRQNLIGEIAQFNVTVRDMLRLANHPKQAETFASITHNQPNKASLVKQSQKSLSNKLTKQQKQVSKILSLRYKQQKQLSLQTEHTQQLAKKQKRLRALQKSYLKKLKLEDKKLAKKLQNALPQNAKTTFPKIEMSSMPSFAGPYPVKGFLVHGYGKTANDMTHDGITVQALPGATISSVKGGRVIFSGPFREYGWLVILETGPEKHDVYGGMAMANVHIGQTVKEHAPLGLLPNTPEPTLYFESRENNRSIEPLL